MKLSELCSRYSPEEAVEAEAVANLLSILLLVLVVVVVAVVIVLALVVAATVVQPRSLHLSHLE